MKRRSNPVAALSESFLKELETQTKNLLARAEYEPLAISIEQDRRGRYPSMTVRVTPERIKEKVSV